VFACLLSQRIGREVGVVYADKNKETSPPSFYVSNPELQLASLSEIDQQDIRVWGVEDVVTTWGSLRRGLGAVSAAAFNQSGKRVSVVGMSAFAQRRASVVDNVNDPARLSLLNLNISQWPEHDCLLCDESEPDNNNQGVPVEGIDLQRIFRPEPRRII